MARIKQLDTHVANLIAAGEVVERPASVVKELMENAMDAGATQITVEIQNGGMSLIRITDNGSGIPAEDAETAFLRHATSKIQTERDLEAIGTLGFRGEALAAIAAVSRTELLTRTQNEPFGTALCLEGGVLQTREETGCPVGTTMVVRNLFFNTPARLKFMKRDAAEGAAVFGSVQRMALAHPSISIKFLRDGKQDLLTPGDAKLSSAMYSVFGRDIAVGLTEVAGSGDEVSVTGFVSMPACCRGTRGYQHFILNGRPIRSRLLTAALEEAYQNQKMVGKFPACVLHIELKPNAVDVNVHPAKTEVKFLSDKKTFDAVYYTVLSALGEERRHPVLHLEPQKPTMPIPKSEGFQSMNAQQFRDSMTATIPKPIAVEVHPSAKSVAIAVEERQREEVPISTLPQYKLPLYQTQEQKAERIEPVAPSEDTEKRKLEPIPEPEEKPPVKRIDEPQEEPEQEPWRLAGEVLSTYIVVEQGDAIYLIDKHAAHERMHFDRMKSGEYQPMSQTLLEPLVITLPPEERETLLAELPLLEEFGFSVEDFGGGALVVRQLPFDVSPGEAEELLGQLAKAILSRGRADPAAARDNLLHTMACKAAIKGGQKSAKQELMVVAEAVMSGAVKYCPHGRPVAITLTRSQLERQFGRA